jgi:hypothetical protein
VRSGFDFARVDTPASCSRNQELTRRQGMDWDARKIENQLKLQLSGIHDVAVLQCLCWMSCIRMNETLGEFEADSGKYAHCYIETVLDSLKNDIMRRDGGATKTFLQNEFEVRLRAINNTTNIQKIQIIPQVGGQAVLSVFLLTKLHKMEKSEYFEILMSGIEAVAWFLDSNDIKLMDRRGVHPLLSQEFSINEHNKRLLMVTAIDHASFEQVEQNNKKWGGLRQRLRELSSVKPSFDQLKLF